MNLIFTSFQYKPSANKAHNIPLDIYLKNIFSSLYSAKFYNKNDDVALIVTQETRKLLPDSFVELCNKNQILIKEHPFNHFVMSDGRIWSFSFYRLSIMYDLCETNEYENMISIDSDTITTRSFDSIWFDCKNFVLLVDIEHTNDIQQAIDTNADLVALSGENVFPINYGGEFIAMSSEKGKLFLNSYLEVFNAVVKKNIKFTHGDETILALTGWKCLKDNSVMIKNAACYCARYWTGHNFYYVSTNYKNNPVSIIHVPDEKFDGLIRIYKYILRAKTMPTLKRTAKFLGIAVKRNHRPLVFIKRFFRFMKSKRN